MTPPASPDSDGRKVLLVIGHGREAARCHPLLRTARDALVAQGASVRTQDLLADGFDPVLRMPNEARHASVDHCTEVARRYHEDVLWMDALVVVHPVWWFAPPAILKGWVDQVLVDGVGIEQPAEGPPKPGLTGKRAIVIQTFNAARMIDRLIMRSMAEQFWRRVVFLSTGIETVQRIGLYGVEDMTEAELRKHEQKIERAVVRL